MAYSLVTIGAGVLDTPKSLLMLSSTYDFSNPILNLAGNANSVFSINIYSIV